MPKMILRRVLPGMLLMGREDCLLVPVRPQDAEAVRKWKNQNLRGDVRLPRHLKGHNLYHAVIAEACNQWRGAPFPKGDADLLRYWLEYKAGPEFCWRAGPFPPEFHQTVCDLISQTRAEDRYSFVEPVINAKGDPEIYVFTPKSEAFEEMPEEVANKLRRAVFELIEITLGIENAESLVKEKLRAA